MSAITITFRFLNQPLLERVLDREGVREAVIAAIDDLADEQLEDLDMIDVSSEDQFLRKL